MTENPYTSLDEKGVKEQIALFKEALKGKDNIDLYEEFTLEKPKEITEDEKTQLAALKENSDKLSQITKLLGVSKDNKTSTEPTDAEKELLARQEKLEKSAFTDKVAEIKSINSEFDATSIEELEIPTSEKVTVAGTVKEIITKYQTGYDKLKAELTTSNAGTKDTKLSSKKQNEGTSSDGEKPGAGKDIVSKMATRYNLKTETKSDKKSGDKTE